MSCTVFMTSVFSCQDYLFWQEICLRYARETFHIPPRIHTLHIHVHTYHTTYTTIITGTNDYSGLVVATTVYHIPDPDDITNVPNGQMDWNQILHIDSPVVEGKGFPILDIKHWAQSWSRVQAVNLEVTVSHPPGGRLPLRSSRSAVTFPAAEHHRPFGRYQVILLGDRGT